MDRLSKWPDAETARPRLVCTRAGTADVEGDPGASRLDRGATLPARGTPISTGRGADAAAPDRAHAVLLKQREGIETK